MIELITERDMFRPSKLAQLELCPGALKMCLGQPKTESEIAKEGTFLHKKVAEHSFEGLTTEQTVLIERCQECLNRLASTQKWEHEIELSLTNENFDVLIHGTADAIFVKDKNAILCEWKFGYIPVPPADKNLQVQMYACMMFQAHDIDSCEVVIFQPRLGNEGFSRHNFSREELADFPQRIMKIKAETQNGTQLHAGEKQCKYCAAKEVCPEYKHFTGQVSAEIAKVGHTSELTCEELTKALEQTAEVKDFIKQLEAKIDAIEYQARERLLKNETIEGWKLKTKKGKRECKNPQVVFELLHDVVPVEKFLSAVKISMSDLDELYAKSAVEKKIYKSQTEAVRKLAEIIAPYVERKSDSYILVKEDRS